MDGRRNVGHIQRDKYRKLKRQPDRIRISKWKPCKQLERINSN